MLDMLINFIQPDSLSYLPNADIGAIAGFTIATGLKNSFKRIARKVERIMIKIIVGYAIILLGVITYKCI